MNHGIFQMIIGARRAVQALLFCDGERALSKKNRWATSRKTYTASPLPNFPRTAFAYLPGNWLAVGAFLLIFHTHGWSANHYWVANTNKQWNNSGTAIQTDRLDSIRPILTGLQRPKMIVSEGVLKQKLDAGYYTLFKGQLKFRYDEEYVSNGNKLEFNIYDKNRTVVLSNTSPGVAVNIAYKDNRCGLNLKALNPTLPSGYYVLEVKDKKGEVGMLRFKL